MGAVPGVIHTGRFFVLIPLKVVGKMGGFGLFGVVFKGRLPKFKF
jgi:hypothetical protein